MSISLSEIAALILNLLTINFFFQKIAQFKLSIL